MAEKMPPRCKDTSAPATNLSNVLIFPPCGFSLRFAWAINRNALRKRLEPRLAELEKLRNDVLSSGDS
jgi:hypothetical protein